jgi:hypothetical protein
MISTEISPDVSALVNVLDGVAPGSTVTYQELSATIGRNIKSCYWMVLQAKKIAARDHGAVFGTQRKVGFRRLTTEELHTVGNTARAMIRRRSRVAAKLIRQGAAKANDVSPEATRRMNAELSALGLIGEIAKDEAAKPVETHDQRPEPVAVIAKRMLEGLDLVSS